MFISAELMLNRVSVNDVGVGDGERERNGDYSNHSNGSVIEIKPVKWELKC